MAMGERRTVRHRVLALLLLLFAGPSLSARVLPEGPLPPLSGDDGYLVVAVHSNRLLDRLRLAPAGAVFGRQEIRALPLGRSVHVLRVPAGPLRWDRVVMPGGTYYFDLTRYTHLPQVTVAAGRLNYAGELHLRFFGRRMSADLLNHFEQGMQLAAQRHPGVDTLPAVQAVRAFDDAWPALRAGLNDSGGLRPDACPAPADLPQGRPDVASLFRREEVDRLTLSPTGELALEVAHRSNRVEASVLDPVRGEALLLYGGDFEVMAAAWAGPRRIVLGLDLGASDGVLRTVVFSLQEGSLTGQQPVVLELPLSGVVVDALPGQPDQMLYGVFRPDHKDRFQVFRIDLRARQMIRTRLDARNRIDPDVQGDLAWLADRRGELRVALVSEDERMRIVHRPPDQDRFETLVEVEAGNMLLDPVALEDDGSLLVLSNIGREQTELVRIRPDSPGHMETVHAIPGIDLSGVVFESDGRTVVGVRHYQDGQPHSEFFDTAVAGWAARLQAAFPDRHAELVEVDRRQGRAIVRVSSDTRTPVWYLFDQASNMAMELAVATPWLDDVAFVPRRVEEVRARDGHRIQSLLAVPPGQGPHPLLVMPHGGPFYVQDNLRFDREVQFWATRGFAVLQVNFRGSYGFGVQHLLDGFGGFGSQIEDDIEAAVDAVLDSHSGLDRGAVCAVGASYGGYSALMLAIRNPGRYRCAVARAAPADLPLLFTSSDWSSSPRTRGIVVEAIGDPRDPGMQENSPLYRADRLEVPVLLQHGGRDRRVSYEHAARFARRLDPDKGHRLLHIPEMGHGATRLQEHVCLLGTAERFVRGQIHGDRGGTSRPSGASVREESAGAVGPGSGTP